MSSARGWKGADDLSSLMPPALSPAQNSLLREYADLLAQFNRKLNLVSRDSMEDVRDRHIFHSLCLAYRNFRSETTVVDWGTGGGLPLIPLAVAFPDVRFVGIDSVEKKVMAVRQMVRQLGLQNVTVHAGRAEDWDGTLDYSVSRATAPLATLWSWHVRCRMVRVSRPAQGEWPPGLICLKGGDLAAEMDNLKTKFPDLTVDTISLASVPGAVQFAEKVIVVVADIDAARNGGS